MSAEPESAPRETKAEFETRVRGKALVRAVKSPKAQTLKRPAKKKPAVGRGKAEAEAPRQVQAGRGNL